MQAEGGLRKVSAIRTFEPDERVQARIEISAGRMRRRREAGVDVMGDGSLVPYLGGISKQRLESAGDEAAFDAVREALHA